MNETKVMLIAACVLGASAAWAGAVPSRPASSYADIVLEHGKIVTVDSHFDVYSAIAIRADRVMDVGSDAKIAGLIGPSTTVVDLMGRTVIPGLIDDHYHFMKQAVDAYLGVNVTLVKSIHEMVARIGEKVARTPPGKLVYTSSGWLPLQLAERRPPNRYDLDPVSPHNPVVVQGGHSIYLNSYALHELRITRDTVSPPGGVIVKDARTGEPTGCLVENATLLARSLDVGAATEGQKLAALRAGERAMNAVGITSIREPAVTAANMRIYQELRDSGQMTVRISMSYDVDPSQPIARIISELRTWGVSTGFGDSMLRLDGIGELMIDGGFEGALMSQHYTHAPGGIDPQRYFGLQRIPTGKFDRIILEMNRLNWRGAVHVAGDRALDIVLDAYEKADREKPIARKRWTLEHLLYTRPDQFERIKNLGVVVSTQFHAYMAAADIRHYWGRERAAKVTRVRDWLQAGLTVGGGSDWSLMPADPFWMMYFFATRNSRLSGPIGPDEAVSREEALRMMTINNAYITMEERVKGSLEPGKLADLLVLSADPLTVPAKQIRDITPLVTMVGGNVVYRQPHSHIGLD